MLATGYRKFGFILLAMIQQLLWSKGFLLCSWRPMNEWRGIKCCVLSENCAIISWKKMPSPKHCHESFPVESTSNGIHVVISWSKRETLHWFLFSTVWSMCVRYSRLCVQIYIVMTAQPRTLASQMNTHFNKYRSRSWTLSHNPQSHSPSSMSIDTLTFSVVCKTFQRCGNCGFRPRQRHRVIRSMLCADSINYVSDFMQWYWLMRLSVYIIVQNASHSQRISELLLLLLLLFLYVGYYVDGRLL